MDTEEIEVTTRDLKCEFNVIKNPDGSAILSQGDTTFLAAVYGPVEVKLQKLQIDRATVETVYKPKSGNSSVSDRTKESIIRNIFEAALLTTLHPRTAISIIIQEMQDCGGGLACAVNAASLALVNSGLSMKYLVAAVSCMVDKEGEIIVDPDSKQLENAAGSMTFVFDNVLLDIIAMHSIGDISQEQYEGSLARCKSCAEKIFVYIRDTVQRYANRL